MNGRIWVGRASMPAGRAGEAPSSGLTEALVALGFETDRLKTGTPARVDSRTVDFSALEAQPGEAIDAGRWFSFDPEAHVAREQMACHLTHTTAATHKLIRDNLAETPVYGGWVDAKGPRYCPSIEDKIVRFADKESHQARRARRAALRWCVLAAALHVRRHKAPPPLTFTPPSTRRLHPANTDLPGARGAHHA